MLGLFSVLYLVGLITLTIGSEIYFSRFEKRFDKKYKSWYNITIKEVRIWKSGKLKKS